MRVLIIVFVIYLIAGWFVYRKCTSHFPEMCPMNLKWDGNYDKIDQKLYPAIKHRKSIVLPPWKQKIPRVIYQTHERDEIPSGMREAVETILHVNQTYEYKYFNAKEAKTFIIDNIGERAGKCYDKLVPGAYKADLFRYCLMYINGGVYIDAGFIAINPLDKVIDPDDEFISAMDSCKPEYCNGQKGVYNAFICCVPGHPIMRYAIDKVLDNIERNYYGICSIAPTGPLVLGEAFKNVTGKDINEETYPRGIKLLRFYAPTGCLSGVIFSGSDKIFYTKYPFYREELKLYTNQQDYHQMWAKRQIYE
uniref:Glycosyltransferase n=1 Tax=Marseillevirus LCMAC102 TaxID=2506603 RepID=A0A481YVB1_9VIRU|nr:MAG: glycosyltransferase [Marseillevirus LCMAC102]